MDEKRKGRPPGTPTEPARLTPDQAKKLKVIAEGWTERDGEEWTVRAVLEKLAGKNIDRAYRRVMDRTPTGNPVA